MRAQLGSSTPIQRVSLISSGSACVASALSRLYASTDWPVTLPTYWVTSSLPRSAASRSLTNVSSASPVTV